MKVNRKLVLFVVVVFVLLFIKKWYDNKYDFSNYVDMKSFNGIYKYTVKEGDTLSGILHENRKVMGASKNVPVRALVKEYARANSKSYLSVRLSNIYPGENLFIPIYTRSIK